jgi:hypothetical protein
MGTAASVVELLSRRIRQGDYALAPLPTERDLAAEAGVSYMTARKAVQQVIAAGLLLRDPHGRLELARQAGAGRRLQFAFLSPTFASADIERWRLALDVVCMAAGASLRPVLYIHWDDPLVADCLGGFDGIFLVPNNEPLPPRLLQRLCRPVRPVVVLDEDWSRWKLPSLRLCPPDSIAALLRHLVEAGFEAGRPRVDCLNVQPLNPVVQARIDRWRTWLAGAGGEGELVNQPIAPYERPLVAAHRMVASRLAEGWRPAPALLAITAPAAIGAIRALHDHGLEAGRDVALGVVNGEGMAEFHVPSITAVEPPDPQPFLARCVDWMAAGGGRWSGPLLMEPAGAPLVIRESSTPNTGRRNGAGC